MRARRTARGKPKGCEPRQARDLRRSASSCATYADLAANRGGVSILSLSHSGTNLPEGDLSKNTANISHYAGYVRIDSVRQGDEDGVKGVYHINAVDCVTQWEIVATCERLSEAPTCCR